MMTQKDIDDRQVKGELALVSGPQIVRSRVEQIIEIMRRYSSQCRPLGVGGHSIAHPPLCIALTVCLDSC